MPQMSTMRPSILPMEHQRMGSQPLQTKQKWLSAGSVAQNWLRSDTTKQTYFGAYGATNVRHRENSSTTHTTINQDKNDGTRNLPFTVQKKRLPADNSQQQQRELRYSLLVYTLRMRGS